MPLSERIIVSGGHGPGPPYFTTAQQKAKSTCSCCTSWWSPSKPHRNRAPLLATPEAIPHLKDSVWSLFSLSSSLMLFIRVFHSTATAPELSVRAACGPPPGIPLSRCSNSGWLVLARRVRPRLKVPIVIELGQVPIGFDLAFFGHRRYRRHLHSFRLHWPRFSRPTLHAPRHPSHLPPGPAGSSRA